MKTQHDQTTRKNIVLKVHEVFASLGEDIADLVLECALDPEVMSKLLRRLKLADEDEGLDRQLSVLRTFADQVGEMQFLMKARYEMWKALQSAERMEIEKLDVAKSLARATRLSRTPLESQSRVLKPETKTPEGEAKTTPPGATPAPRDGRITTQDGSVTTQHGLRGNITENLETRSKEPVKPTDSNYINAPGYQGPERRRLRYDRRSHFDRRGAGEQVMREKRYGVDRRARRRGRRKTDLGSLF